MKALKYLSNVFEALFTCALTNYSPGASGQTLANDIELLIADDVLRIAQRNIIAQQFGQALRIEKGQGSVYTAFRFERLALPIAPLSEGTASAGQPITNTMVQATAQQWGDLVRITDLAELEYKHSYFQQSIRLLGFQQVETYERNTINILLTGTQVNYANGRANRASLVATDVLTPVEIGKAVGSLGLFGAPRFNGDERTDLWEDAKKLKKDDRMPGSVPHYVSMVNNLPMQDLMQNSTIATALSYSNINGLYNNDLGQWGDARFCVSNMIPYWVGVAAVNGTAGSAGNLATATYYIIVTGSPAATSVEQRIYQVLSSISVTGPNGSISVTLPNYPGYVFSVYVGTTTTPTNLGLSASGPAVGALAGQATQLASGSTAIITGVGIAQTPQAAPATGITVFPTFFFGSDAYGQVTMEDIKYYYLDKADKSDPQNQFRVVSWKGMYGTIILNNAYFMRTESSSAFSPGYTSGTATE